MKVRRKRCDDRNRGSESERDLKSKAVALKMEEEALSQGSASSHQKPEEERKRILPWSLRES